MPTETFQSSHWAIAAHFQNGEAIDSAGMGKHGDLNGVADETAPDSTRCDLRSRSGVAWVIRTCHFRFDLAASHSAQHNWLKSTATKQPRCELPEMAP